MPRQPSPGTFRDRWASKFDFTADLVAYTLWAHNYTLHMGLAEEADSLLADPSKPLSKRNDEIAYDELALATDPQRIGAFCAQMVLQPLAAHDAAVATAITLVYDQFQKMWSATYRQFLERNGFVLRPDISVDELTIILTAVSEGLTLRALAEGPARVMDDEKRTSLLGVVTMALLLTCVDAGDGRTLREFVDLAAGAQEQEVDTGRADAHPMT